MGKDFLLFFGLSIFLSVIITPVVLLLAKKISIVDLPGGDRKIHTQATPLLGGLAIYLSFALTILTVYFLTSHYRLEYIHWQQLIGIILGGLFLMIGGCLDDKYRLSPLKQIICPIIAVIMVMISGVGIRYITNPFGGLVYLGFFGLSQVFTFVWLMGMMYTTKLLDGLDGLVSGIGLIAAVMIFLVSLSRTLQQVDTALLAIIFAGAVAGFLVFNFYPARIFLGESGALFIGFMIAVLAIIAGGKISTALLVMGIPILDVLWIIIRRKFWEKKSPFLSADRKHLHFRLVNKGFSHRQAVLLYYGFILGLGSFALIVQGTTKIIALAAMVFLMFIIGIMVAK